MTSEQENHLQSIKDAFTVYVDMKYRKGQEEHGGNLFDKTELELVDDAISESIDQFTYLVTLRNRLLSINNQTGGKGGPFNT